MFVYVYNKKIRNTEKPLYFFETFKIKARNNAGIFTNYF